MEDRDFIDFKFGDYWASDFNLLAVSSGDRYSPPVYGSVNPNTATIAGKIGVYKWKTQINEKVFNINISFDNINGQILNQIKEWLNPFKIDKLIFKEEPYKYYWVTLNTEPKLNFLPFLEEEKIVNGIAFKEGVYRGEFELQFVCFDNYGYSDWQSFDENYDYIFNEINNQEFVSFNDGSDNNLIIDKIEGNSEQRIIEEVIGDSISNEFITVNDVNLDDGRIEISGNSKQETREGYNLVKMRDVANITTSSGIIFSAEDDVISMDGTNAFTYATVYGANLIYNLSSDIKTYTLKFIPISGSMVSGYIGLRFLDSNDTQIGYIQNTSSDILISKELDLTNLSKIQLFATAGATFSNFKFKILFTKGTEDKEWEAYGATPSLEFPSEVEVVGNNINLYNENMTTRNKYINPTNGSLIDSTTAKASDYIEIPEGKYTISFTNDGKLHNIVFFDENKQYIKGNNYVSVPYIFEKSNDAKYIRFDAPLNAENIKLEKGIMPTSYSQYGKGNINITKCSKNLFNSELYESTSEINVLDNKNGVLELRGVQHFWATISKRFYFGKNKKLFFGFNYEKKDNGSDIVSITDSSGKGVNMTTITWNDNCKLYSFIVPDDGILNVHFRCNEATNTGYVKYSNIIISEENISFIPHESQIFAIPIQQEMLEGDYFEDTECHKWVKIVLDGVNYVATGESTITSGKYRYKVDIYKYNEISVKNCSLSEEKAYCTHLKLLEKGKTFEQKVGFTILDNSIYIYTNGETAKEFNNYLKENNMTFYIPLKENYYKRLELTNEQKAVLDEIRNIKMYKSTTNIYSTNGIKPNISLKYNYVLPSPSQEVVSPIKTIKQGSNIIIEKCNKNLFKNLWKTKEWNGIQIIKNSDDSMTVKGTTTAGTYFSMKLTLPKGSYIFSAKGMRYDWDVLRVEIKKSNGENIGNWYNAYQSINVLLEEETTIHFSIVPTLKAVNINCTFYPMIRAVTDMDDTYIKHQSQTFILPVQQEMLEGDYISEVEHHEWGEIIFTGEENFIYEKSENKFSVYNLTDIKVNDEQLNLSKCTHYMNFNEYANSINSFGIMSGAIRFHNDLNFSSVETWKNWLKEQYDNGTPVTIKYKIRKPFDLPLTEEQSIIINQLKEDNYSYEGTNNIFTMNEIHPLLSTTYIPKQNIYIDFMANTSNLLNDSAFYYNNDIYKKSYFDYETGDATKSGISEDRPVYLYNAGTTAANLNLTFDMIIPAEGSPLVINTESCKLTDNGIQVLKQISSISISDFSKYKPFLEIYDGTPLNWQIQIDSNLCEVYLKHKTDKVKIISLNKFNDNQSFLSLANCNFVDYSKPFPTLITAISGTALENTIFNKLSIGSSVQNYRLKNVDVEWKHTYL